MRARAPSPVFIPLASGATLSAPAYTDNGDIATCDGGSVDIWIGSEKVTDSGVLDTAEVPAIHVSSAFADFEPRADVLIVWNLSIAGAPHVIRQHAYLVNDLLYCPITEQDLYGERAQTETLLPAGRTNYRKEIDQAWNRVIRRLKRLGRNAALILDSDSLFDVTLYEALMIIYGGFGSTMNSPNYKEEYDTFSELAKAEWASLQVIYDRDANGTISTPETETAYGPLVTVDRR